MSGFDPRNNHDHGSVDPRALFRFLRENDFILVIATLLGLSVALAYLHWSHPVYVSYAILEVSEDAPALRVDGEPVRSDPGSATTLKTIEQIVGSDAVLGRVIAANHLAENPAFSLFDPNPTEAGLIAALRRRVSVSLVRGTRLIRVQAADPDPRLARQLVQSIVDEYFAQEQAGRRNSSSEAQRFLMEEVKRVSLRLNEAEVRLQEYRREHGSLALNDQSAINVDRLRNLQERLNDAKNRRIALESERDQVESALASADPDRLLDLRSVAERPDILELQKSADARAIAVASLADRYRARHPTMIKARNELEMARRVLHQSARSAAESVLLAFRAAQATESFLQEELERQEQSALAFNGIAIRYRALEREAASDATLHQQLLARLKQVEVSDKLLATERLAGSPVRLVVRPLLPAEPVPTQRRLALPAGLLAGCLLGFTIALVRRAMDDTVTSLNAAESLPGAANLLVVPRSRHLRLRTGRAPSIRPGAAETEVFRSLRTTLALQPDSAARRATLFTSALPGEGKSCCSAHFAIATAQSGVRTLLIDGDLRRPALRRAFGRCSEKAGLGDCLVNPDHLDSAIDDTAIRHLHLLGNSCGTPHGSELLSRPALGQILGRCLAQFDRIVIDSAPVAVVSDALLLARLAPTVCLVVQARRTPRPLVARVSRQLQAVTGRPVAAVVLTQMHGNRAARDYYDYYGAKHTVVDLVPAPAAG